MATILQFDRCGGPEVLAFREVEAPLPGPGEVRYRVEAFALNRGDLFWLQGTYFNAPVLPARIGQEAYGVVDAVGAGVAGFAVGDRVCSLPQEDGRYCVNGTFAISLARYLVHWSGIERPEDGCAMWSQALTAYYPLVELRAVGPGQTVLITAGSSTAGNGAIRMAKLLGAHVIATSRTFDKRAFLLGLGADAVIATDSEDLASRVREETGGRGADVVFDTVAGPMMPRYLDALAPGAGVFIVGALSGDLTLSGPLLPLVRAGATITGYSVFICNRDDAMLGRAKAFVSAGIADGRLRPVIDRIFSFGETVDAYRYLQSGGQRGKIVVRV